VRHIRFYLSARTHLSQSPVPQQSLRQPQIASLRLDCFYFAHETLSSIFIRFNSIGQLFCFVLFCFVCHWFLKFFSPNFVLVCEQLLRSHADNNVKLIILDRLADLQKTHLSCIQEVVLEIIVAMQSNSPDIQKKAIDLTLLLVTSRTAQDVVQAIRKEMTKSQNADKTVCLDSFVYFPLSSIFVFLFCVFFFFFVEVLNNS
jgi:hypothetical protein